MILAGCGRAPWDIENETDRNSMIFEIRNSLTEMNCSNALTLAKQLYESKYSNNEIRMLYASAQGCNVGIILYPLIDAISTADLSSQDAIFKTMVRLFPSRTALDSKLQSTWYMQDILHSILKPGVVIGASDLYTPQTYNPSSVLYRDRTDDGNAFLVFASMAGVGTSLNRYGYNASDDPAALSYAQVLPLTWTTKALIQADATHAGCSLASSLMNMFDAVRAASSFTSGSVATAFSSILSVQPAVELFGDTECVANAGYTAQRCSDAKQRLRYRDACFDANNDKDAVAAYAGGIIQAIEAGWN